MTVSGSHKKILTSQDRHGRNSSQLHQQSDEHKMEKVQAMMKNQRNSTNQILKNSKQVQIVQPIQPNLNITEERTHKFKRNTHE